MFPGYAAARSAGVTEIPESLLQDVVVTRETLAFLLEHHDATSREGRDVPWFVCASYGRPHPPFTAPGRYIRHYRDKVPPVELPSNYLKELEPYARRLAERHRDLTTAESLRGREGYYACVDFVDDCIGELLSGLERAGLLENTIVIYTSDHGEMLGAHGIWGKTVYFEPSLAVPLLIGGPGIRAGHHQVSHPISLMDLFPTTCALAGLPVPPGLDGLDFSQVLANPASAPPPREFAPGACYLYGQAVKTQRAISADQPHAAMRVIRQQDWKYVEIEGGRPLLFDLANDPQEKINLANDPEQADRCRVMRQALFQGFSWEQAHAQLAADQERIKQFKSGQKPTTPNQYRLEDGRMFDAEGDLYEARWLSIPPGAAGGIIPQQFG